jgi:CHASE2 domain-containing sensor protein
LALKVHGAAAFVAMLALGAMGAVHARRAWVLRRNRFSGLIVATAFGLLVLSGYALYYLVDEITRPAVSILHWSVGLALVPMLVVHIAVGRRNQSLGGRAGQQRRHASVQAQR